MITILPSDRTQRRTKIPWGVASPDFEALVRSMDVGLSSVYFADFELSDNRVVRQSKTVRRESPGPGSYFSSIPGHQAGRISCMRALSSRSGGGLAQ